MPCKCKHLSLSCVLHFQILLIRHQHSFFFTDLVKFAKIKQTNVLHSMPQFSTKSVYEFVTLVTLQLFNFQLHFFPKKLCKGNLSFNEKSKYFLQILWSEQVILVQLSQQWNKTVTIYHVFKITLSTLSVCNFYHVTIYTKRDHNIQQLPVIHKKN